MNPSEFNLKYTRRSSVRVRVCCIVYNLDQLGIVLFAIQCTLKVG